eukprot:NODE_432_length_7521_cov_0.745891.p1 type:complete len:355 gc:universal NODE_432_length_7521_cov_0.745891:6112-5048(-)
MIESIWICILGFIVAFMDGFGMGANDVSHSFGTSVGSGTLTMLQACTIALFTEFAGAALLGNNNAQTISGLVIADEFKEEPSVLMLIMACALLGSSVWTITSAKIGLPVSSTHSISGAIIGCVLFHFGASHINWSLNSGVTKIVISWITSPIIAAVFAASLYQFVKFTVLRYPDSYHRAQIAIPYYFTFTVFIDVFLIITKTHISHDLNFAEVLIISAVVSFISFLFFKFMMVPWIVRRIDNQEDLKWYDIFRIFLLPTQPKRLRNEHFVEKNLTTIFTLDEIDEFELDEIRSTRVATTESEILLEKNAIKKVDNLHQEAEQFDEMTEQLFGYVQVLTAIFASFSHGAKYFLFT